MQTLSFFRVAKTAFVDGLLEILRFPFWWYTHGLKQTFLALIRSINTSVLITGLGIWSKNLFVPMYGETSILGRVISFFVRLFMVVIRGMGVVLWALVAFCLFVFYLVAPPIALIGFFSHLVVMIS